MGRIPEFVTKGVDIHVDKIVKEYSNGTKNTTYEAYAYSRDERPMPLRMLGEGRSEIEIARVISSYVKEIKQRYSFPDFDCKMTRHGSGYAETKSSVTEDECKSIEGLLD